jgi:hypothetical protein
MTEKSIKYLSDILMAIELIKEPAGVDFIIQSKPLTDLERKEISEYIRSKKLKKKAVQTKKTIKKSKINS